MMKLKTILILSYLGLIIGLSLFFSVVHFFVIRQSTKSNVVSAIDFESKLEKKNVAISTQMVLPFGKNYIRLETKIAAQQLSHLMEKEKLVSFDEIKNRPEIVALANQPIYSQKTKVGYMVLYSKKANKLLSPNPNVRNMTITEMEKKFPKLENLFKKALKDGKAEGYYDYYDDKTNKLKMKFISIVKVPRQTLYMASTLYLEDYLKIITKRISDAQELELEVLKKHITSSFSESLLWSVIISLVAMISLSCGAAVFGYWLANRISHPLVKLQTGVKRIGVGDFHVKVEESGSLETVALAQCFNQLGEQLVRHIEDLKKEVGARKAVESEIRIVGQIQASTLPKNSEEFQSPLFSLEATLLPAKEAAGDFYDFFYLDPGKIALVIGDVSGKGLSAAFLMTECKTLVRAACKQFPDSPAKAMRETNSIIANDNPECMFVTLFVAYCDLNTWKMIYSNAGHHDAIRIGCDGELDEFGVFYDPAIGFTPEVDYKTGEINLAPGETMLLYTDGIVEARAENDEFYGDERLKDLLKSNFQVPVKEICAKIIGDVMEFEPKEQFDDITLLAFRREDA